MVVALPAAATGGFPYLEFGRAAVAALTITAAEGVLAVWGYTVALARNAGAPLARWVPSRRAAGFLLLGGFLLGAAVAPLPPLAAAARVNVTSLARLAGLPWRARAGAGFLTNAVAVGAAAVSWLALRAGSGLARVKKTAPPV